MGDTLFDTFVQCHEDICHHHIPIRLQSTPKMKATIMQIQRHQIDQKSGKLVNKQINKQTIGLNLDLFYLESMKTTLHTESRTNRKADKGNK